MTTARIPRTMVFSMLKLRFASTFLLLLGLTSCSSHSHPVTESEAIFLSASAHQLIVRFATPGDFTNSRTLPLDTNAVVSIGGKESNLGKLQAGQNIRIIRDDVTHEVVGIEAR